MKNYDKVVEYLIGSETVEDYANFGDLIEDIVNSMGFRTKELLAAVKSNPVALQKMQVFAEGFTVFLANKPYADGRNKAAVEWAFKWCQQNGITERSTCVTIAGKLVSPFRDGFGEWLAKSVEKQANEGKAGFDLGPYGPMVYALSDMAIKMHPTLQQTFAGFCKLVLLDRDGRADEWVAFPFI